MGWLVDIRVELLDGDGQRLKPTAAAVAIELKFLIGRESEIELTGRENSSSR